MLPTDFERHSMDQGSSVDRRFSGPTVPQDFNQDTRRISAPAQSAGTGADYLSPLYDPFALLQVHQAASIYDRPLIQPRRRSQRLAQALSPGTDYLSSFHDPFALPQAQQEPLSYDRPNIVPRRRSQRILEANAQRTAAPIESVEGDYFSIHHRESFALPEVPKDIQRIEKPEQPEKATPKSRKRSRREAEEMTSETVAEQMEAIDPVEKNEDSEPDKKRNKLGYQRSNIACGKWDCSSSLKTAG